jgi:hypothetical protein
LQEPELSLRRCSAATISDIAKHSPELAQGIVDSGVVPFIAPLITHTDTKLKREVLSTYLCVKAFSSRVGPASLKQPEYLAYWLSTSLVGGTCGNKVYRLNNTSDVQQTNQSL